MILQSTTALSPISLGTNPTLSAPVRILEPPSLDDIKADLRSMKIALELGYGPFDRAVSVTMGNMLESAIDRGEFTQLMMEVWSDK